MNLLPVARGKRPRPNILPLSSDLSVLDKVSVDSTQVRRFPRVLQGQEVMTLGGSLGDSDLESGQKTVVWGSKLDDVKSEGMGCQRRLLSENWIPPLRHDSVYSDTFSSFQPMGEMQEFHGSLPNSILEDAQQLKVLRKQFQDQEGKIVNASGLWSTNFPNSLQEKSFVVA